MVMGTFVSRFETTKLYPVEIKVWIDSAQAVEHIAGGEICSTAGLRGKGVVHRRSEREKE